MSPLLGGGQDLKVQSRNSSPTTEASVAPWRKSGDRGGWDVLVEGVHPSPWMPNEDSALKGTKGRKNVGGQKF